MKAKDYAVILDSMQTTGVYVIREDNHQFLYYNKRVKEVAPNIQPGMNEHIAKPLNIEQLMKCMKHWFSKGNSK